MNTPREIIDSILYGALARSPERLSSDPMSVLELLTKMVLSGAPKEEVDRAANYAVSVIAVEKSASDCVEAKRANDVDELMKKYYPT